MKALDSALDWVPRVAVLLLLAIFVCVATLWVTAILLLVYALRGLAIALVAAGFHAGTFLRRLAAFLEGLA